MVVLSLPNYVATPYSRSWDSICKTFLADTLVGCQPATRDGRRGNASSQGLITNHMNPRGGPPTIAHPELQNVKFLHGVKPSNQILPNYVFSQICFNPNLPISVHWHIPHISVTFCNSGTLGPPRGNNPPFSRQRRGYMPGLQYQVQFWTNLLVDIYIHDLPFLGNWI